MKKTFLTLLFVFAAAIAHADEGMWMPQQVPQLAAELQRAGAKFDAKKLAHLTGDPMGAVISLGGCTASFVSPDGLIVTNHHCAFGATQYNTTAQRDLITNGFLAKTRADELPAGPGQHVFVTTKIEDVTSRVTGDLAPTLSDADRAREISRRENDLTAECEKPGGVRCRVASFFEGSQYLRTTQLDLTDVRLVYTPANRVGDFGGDVDNFEWPRHAGDFSFLRAYVNGQPYHPAHWLKVSTKGINDGDFVLVAGYPGRTFRYKTADEVLNYQQFIYPTSIKYYTQLIELLDAQGKGKRDVQIRNASRVKSLNNALKNYQSTSEGFTKDRIYESRLAREQKMRAADPQAGEVLDAIAKLNAAAHAAQGRETVLQWITGVQGANGLAYRASPMLTAAVQAYRLAEERSKKDADRATGYHERNVQGIRDAFQRMQRVVEPASDRAAMRYFLGQLPADDAVMQFVASKGGMEPFLDWLYGNTRIANEADRAAMAGETAAQLKARNDSMVQFAALLTPMLAGIDQRELAYEGAMSRLRPRYFEALRKVEGRELYPDANGTLRVTFGTVYGYSPKDATWYTPQTRVAGILQKNTGEEPFDAPKALLAAANDPAKKAGYIDPELHDVPVDFLSTCDTTGGNSGSPTLNANGELCGLLFDGNYESIDADFLFTPEITRSIHVDTQYMLWVMDAVDGAQNLIREMGLTPKF